MESMLLDYIQITFWSVTYVLIICAGFKSRQISMVSMPYVAGVMNFAWETIALFFESKGGNWGHILWFGLDLIIVYFSFKFLKSDYVKTKYILSIIAMTVAFYFVFKIEGGMLYSVFALDLNIAICYIVWRKQMSPHFKIPIAVTKLIGDAFAGIFYAKETIFVLIIAIAVFICNISYLIFCIIEYKTTDRNEYYKLNSYKNYKKQKRRKPVIK